MRRDAGLLLLGVFVVDGVLLLLCVGSCFGVVVAWRDGACGVVRLWLGLFCSPRGRRYVVCTSAAAAAAAAEGGVGARASGFPLCSHDC